MSTQMKKGHLVLALIGLVVLGMVIVIVAGSLGPTQHPGVLPPRGIEKIDKRCMDGCTADGEGRVAFLRAAVDRMILRVGGSFATDPDFWEMLTPEGQAFLSGVTVIATDACVVLPGMVVITGDVCETSPCRHYVGGVYQVKTNTIILCGEAAQADPRILRHEALHALDVADGQPESEACVQIISFAPPRWSVGCFQRLVGGELAREAEALYDAGGGTSFRPNELYAMIPLVVDWRFGDLPPAIRAYYAEWFLDAEEAQ